MSSEGGVAQRYGNGCFIVGEEQDENLTVYHNGGAPGARSTYRTFPNKGYSIVTLTNDEENVTGLAESVERHLISGSSNGLHYFDPRVDPGSFHTLTKDITAIAERMKSELKIESASSSARIAHAMNINPSPIPSTEPQAVSPVEEKDQDKDNSPVAVSHTGPHSPAKR